MKFDVVIRSKLTVFLSSGKAEAIGFVVDAATS